MLEPADTPPSQPPLFQKHRIIPLVLSALMFFISGLSLGYLFWGKCANQEKQTCTTEGAAQTAGSLADNEQQKVTWRTYHNVSYNFLLRYPSNWTVETDEENYVRFKSPGLTSRNADSGTVMEVEMHSRPQKVTLSDLRELTKSSGSVEVYQTKEDVYQGKPMISYKVKSEERSETSGYNIGLDNGFLRIVFISLDEQGEEAITLRKIFSTLQVGN